MGEREAMGGRVRAAARFLTTAAVILLIMTGCAHHSPFREEPYLTSLGGIGEYLLTLDVERSAALTEALTAAFPELDQVASYLELVDRISVSVLLPELQADGKYSETETRLSGAIEGNLSAPLINLILALDRSWEPAFAGIRRIWVNRATGLAVAIPEHGIAFFSTDPQDLPFLLDTTYQNRLPVIPVKIAERLADGLIGMYVERPRNLFSLFEEVIPYSLLISIDSIWLTVDPSADFSVDSYSIYGMIETTQKAATTVISLTLKKKYLEKLRTLTERPANWMEAILVDTQQQIVINNMSIDSDEFHDLIKTMTSTVFQE